MSLQSRPFEILTQEADTPGGEDQAGNIPHPPPDLSPTVGELISSRDAISPATRVDAVADRFFSSPQLEALALVEEGRLCGLATRNKIFGILFRRFGLELFGRDPILEIADRAPLVAAEDERLDLTLDRAMARPFQDIYDEIVVVGRDGCFLGMLSVKQMVIAQGNALAQSVLQRELALTKAREMQKVTDLKTQFLAHVTHELRSPVNAIIALAELLHLSVARGRTEQLEEKLSLLSASAGSLRGIITNILDLSKIEAGRMEVIAEELDLLPLLREVAETTRLLLGAKPVRVAVMTRLTAAPLISDAVKVRQILVNLAGNAAKFTESGEILLALRQEGGETVVTVSDTGIGIREADLERLFTPFTQLEEAKTRCHEGTGLGLAITRQLVRLLGGAIEVRSTFGQGTAFTVRLPAAISSSSERIQA